MQPIEAVIDTPYPELHLEFSYTKDLIAFDTTDFDAALRGGEGHWKGLTSIFLYSNTVPICSPSLLQGLELPVPAEEVARLPIATTKGHSTGWLEWFAAVGIDDTSNLEFIEFDDPGLAFDAASSGRAVALFNDNMLIRHELATGALVVINPLSIKKRGQYLVYPETQHPDAKILAFADWLKSVAARMQAG